MAYDVDLNDKRLVEVTNNKNEALTANEQAYDTAINGVDSKYDALIEASKNHAEEQKKNQQEQTDFAIQEINQQKEQAKKDYTKEQSGAYVDWQKEKDSYGAGAEQRAAAGLAGAGYSESAQVSLYNTYQNRVATAREAFKRAELNYDNAIQKAILQNNSILAEIAFNALQKQLELSLQGFQYKNQLILDKANKKLEIENMFRSQYMQMYNQLFQEEQFKFNQEQARKDEEYRNEQLRIQKEQLELSQAKTYRTAAGTYSVGASGKDRSKSTKSSYEKNSSGVNKNTSGFTGKTYEEAVDYMTENGVKSDYASGIMTRTEWSRRKASYKATGVGSNDVALDSYTDYLNACVQEGLANHRTSKSIMDSIPKDGRYLN